jgi:hypothetical protein
MRCASWGASSGFDVAVAVESGALIDRADAAWELLKAGELDPYDALLAVFAPSEEFKRAMASRYSL